MYYYQNPYFYQYPGQFYVLPPVAPQQYFQPSICETKQIASQEEKKKFDLKIEEIFAQQIEVPLIQKICDQKQKKNQVDSDYEPDNNEAFKFYKKKNTESNLSNQIYSYISSERSRNILLRIFDENNNKVEEFYKLLKKIRKSNKKYMNRNYLVQLVQLKEDNTNFKIYKRCKCPLEPQEVRKAIRISLKYFLYNICDIGLLTSKKMCKLTLMEHFSRKRQIRQFLFNNFNEKEKN